MKALAFALGVLLPASAAADVASDRAAAIVVFPTIEAFRAVEVDGPFASSFTADTVIQLSNTSNQPVRALCFYVNAVGECSVSGLGCFNTFECPAAQDFCVPRWIETDFDVELTPRQPLAWRATVGLTRELLPLDGVNFVGPDGSSNAGTLVPPVRLEESFDPGSDTASLFVGELKCIAVDASGRAVPRNVLKGEATVVDLHEDIEPDVSLRQPIVNKYNAIGIQAIEGDANGDGILELGGGSNEYNGCAQTLIVQHNFDFGVVNDRYVPLSVLYLLPCTQDFRLQVPGSTTAQFLVFNEFEQRFSTSKRVDCLFISFLSEIDTAQQVNSIWSVGVAGTLGGQTRIRGVQTGLVGILNELSIGGLPGEAFVHLGLQGDREQTDRITLPE
jgi:hypothetical protein